MKKKKKEKIQKKDKVLDKDVSITTIYIEA